MRRLFAVLIAFLFTINAALADQMGGGGGTGAAGPLPAPGSTGNLMMSNGTIWTTLAPGAAGNLILISGGIPTWTTQMTSTSPAILTLGKNDAVNTGQIVLMGRVAGSVTLAPAGSNTTIFNFPSNQAVTDGAMLYGATTGGTTWDNSILAGGGVGLLTLGVAGGGGGSLAIVGATSGTATISVPAVAGTPAIVLPTVNRTGLTTLPGSTLPMLISSTGVESTSALSYAQGGTGATSFTNHTLVTAGASAFSGITPGAAGHVPRSNATDYVDAQLGFSDLSGSATLAQFPTIAQNTVLGSVTGGSNVPVALTATQLSTIPNVATDLLQGMAPATTDGKILVGKTGASLQAVSPSGDIASISNAGVVALKTLGTGAGSCTSCNITFDANGRETVYANGSAGSGTVNSGTTPRLAYYASSTTAVSDTGAGLFFTSPSTLVLGAATVGTGVLNLAGTTSGTTSLTVPAAAGSITLTLPGAVATTTGACVTGTLAGVMKFENELNYGTGNLSIGAASVGHQGAVSLLGSTSGAPSLQTSAAAAGNALFLLPAFTTAGIGNPLACVGGNGSDGAGTIGTSTVEGQQFNYTSFTTTSGQTSQRPGCLIVAAGPITLVSTSVITANGVATAATGVGIASAGGTGAAGASAASGPGYGVAPGGGAAAGAATEGPGGGAGAAASGGNGGGAVQAGAPESGLGGINGGGTSHYGGCPNGSGGGGGASGASGTGGNGGGGGNHLTLIGADGFTGTGSVTAPGSAGSNGATLGSGGGGGGAGSLWLYTDGAVALPGATFSAIGGAGGTSAGVAVNSGGGGGGYIGGANGGTTGTATFTVTGGAAGTGGSGAAGTAGGTGLANMRFSVLPTLPQITFDHMNGDSAGKAMCWTLIARKGLHATHTHCDIHLVPQHFEYQPELTAAGYVTHRAEYREARYEHFGDCQDIASENSHIFIWDGEKGQTSAPLSYIAATYAAPGKFSELCMALHFGGDASTASLCDSSNRDQCAKMFDTFKDSPIKGEYPMIPETCTTPNEHGSVCGGLDGIDGLDAAA